MQTHEWEALLDGITPGPWEYREHEHCPYADMEDRATIYGGPMPKIPYPCGCEDDDTCELQRYIVGAKDGVWAHNPPFWDAHPADMKAVAHLPEAVAEVIRLRKAIEAVRDDYQRSAEVDSLLSQFSTVPLVPVFNDLADVLTRILEGDNHE